MEKERHNRLIKLLVSDLDGTLLSAEKKVTPADLKAIKDLKESGVDICLASGRMDNEMAKVALMLQGDFHQISQNGAYVITRERETLYEKVFSEEIARNVYNTVKNPETITLVCSNHTNFVEQDHEALAEIQKFLFFPIEKEPNMSREFGQSLFPSKISVISFPDEIFAIEKAIIEQFSNEVDCYVSAPGCLDIMPKNISKGHSLRILLSHLNLKEEEFACVGDSFNDIPMFNITPHSFAMKGGEPEVQKLTTHVVSSVKDVAQYILDYNAKTSVK